MEQYRLIDSEFTETTGNKFSFLFKSLKQNVILKFYTLQYNCPPQQGNPDRFRQKTLKMYIDTLDRFNRNFALLSLELPQCFQSVLYSDYTYTQIFTSTSKGEFMFYLCTSINKTYWN